jgi:hypothetical protein
MINEDGGIPTNNVSGGSIAGTTPETLGVSVKNMKARKIPKMLTRTLPSCGQKQKSFAKESAMVNKTYSSFIIGLDEAAAKPKPKPEAAPAVSNNKDDISNNIASELFARCRATATTTHFAHLSTDSYSEHKALDTFYTDIIDEIDDFCEAYIGLYGKFITLPPIVPQMQEGEPAIEELRDWVLQNRSLITDDTSLQNAIDDIVTLCNSTIYKLQKLS